MDFIRLSIPRSAAIGIWSALVLLTRMSVELSVILSAIVVISIAMTNNLALVLFVGARSEKTSIPMSDRMIAAGISLAISFGWAILLGRVDPLLLLTLMMLACVVNSAAWPTLISSPTTKAIASVPDVVGSGVIDRALKSDQNSVAGLPRWDSPELRIHELDLPDSDHDLIEESEPSLDERTQWFTRSITGEGELIEGGFRINFAAGQRDAIVHVSFCPPMAANPEMMTEDLDGHDLEIRVAAVFPYGARLTVRRPAGTELVQAVTCRIGYIAFSARIRQAA